MGEPGPESPLEAARLDIRIDALRSELLGFLARRAPREAEELSQEVWLRVARANPDIDDDDGFRAYVYTVARRLLVDHHRRRSARVELVPMDAPTAEAVGDPPLGHGPDSDLHARRMLAVVEQTLAGLTPEQAQVFRWRMTEDVPFREIAERQGCPINTALGRHHRAVKAIAAALEAAGLADDPRGSR